MTETVAAVSGMRLETAALDSEQVHIFCGPFQRHIPAILQLMKSGPAVCFLDPFGVNGISPEELRPLLERKNTELLLNLNTGILRRMAGFEDSDAKDRDAKLANVSRTLGEKLGVENPAWLDKWHELNDSRRWEEWAAKTYMQQLVQMSPDLNYAMAYEVRAKFRGRPKYYLVFASRSPHAFPIMNDILCAEEDNLFAETEAVKPGGQMNFLGSWREQEREDRVRSLAEEVYTFGVQHRSITGSRLLEHFTFEYFAEYRKSHWRKAVELLVSEGRARRSKGRFEDARFDFL